MRSLTKRVGRSLVTMLFAVAMVVSMLLDATAAAPDASASTPTDGDAGSAGGSQIMLVMDSSGSMRETATGGMSKIAAAKKSLNTVIDALPTDQQLGLRVYGAEVFSKNSPAACTDSQLVVPVGSGNREQLHDAVGSYTPYGETPIGYALRQAGRDLGGSGRRNIILVSDGESTCRPDPCRVARDLRRDGIDLRVDVVGLSVANSAREQLRCVAAAGGGIYYDTRDERELTDSLTRISERAARPYEVIGEPVTGTHNTAQAPTIKAGDWVDQIGGSPQDEAYYRVERSMAHSTLYVSAAFRTPEGASNIDVDLYTRDGDKCGSGVGMDFLAHGLLLGAGATAGQISSLLGYEGDPVSDDAPCRTSRALYARVGSGESDTAVPVEIRVSELPDITNVNDLAEPTETPEWSAPPTGSAPVVGGTSFADAEQLQPGGYQGTIVPGETLTFSIEVAWGEQLNVNTVLDQLTETTAAAGAGVPSAYLRIYGPSRLPAGTNETTEDLADDAVVGTSAPADLAQTTSPITYTNLGHLPGASQAGTYTVTLFLEDTPQNASVPVPFDLGIGLTGDADDAPDFDKAPINQAGSDTSTTTTNNGADDTPADIGPDDDGDGISGVSLMLGTLGLAMLAIAGYLFARRRRSALRF